MIEIESPFTLSSAWVIELQTDHPVAAFAATELQTMLQSLGAPLLPIVQSNAAYLTNEENRIILTCGNEGDGFRRMLHEHGIILQGEGARGLLYAVYDLLETLGCRWVSPYAQGAYIPYSNRVVLPTDEVAQQPALLGRCLVIGHDFFLQEAEQWIIWAARNRFNTIFIHTIDQHLALGACHLALWRERCTDLLPLIRERGMRLEIGGHNMSSLLPRKLFHSNPEAFRYNGKQRTPDHNFCASSFAARTHLQSNAAVFFRSFPEANVFHLWHDDLPHGGWCQCSRCSRLSPSDQALAVANELAETLESINPQARISHLCYHDTLSAPTKVTPHSLVVPIYAPRTRSYAWGIGNEMSTVNAPLKQHLADIVATFKPGLRMTSEPRVFEYYLDGILFKSAPPPLPSVIQEDMQTYQAMGVHTIQVLMTGDRPWLAAPMNAWLSARLAWNPAQDPQTLVAEYTRVHRQEAPNTITASAQVTMAYQVLAEAWRPVLDMQATEYQCHTKVQPLRDMVAYPPADVLDYMTVSLDVREKHLARLLPLLSLLEQGKALWDDVAHMERTPEGERVEWEIARLFLQFVVARQQVYVLAGRGAPKAELVSALDQAQAVVDELMQWGTTHLHSGRARANYHLLRMGFQLHLDAIRDRYLASLWQRLWLRLRTYARLAWLTMQVATSKAKPIDRSGAQKKGRRIVSAKRMG